MSIFVASISRRIRSTPPIRTFTRCFYVGLGNGWDTSLWNSTADLLYPKPTGYCEDEFRKCITAVYAQPRNGPQFTLLGIMYGN